METEFLSIGKDGVALRVYGVIDAETAFMLAMALFIGITAALAVYAKALR